MMRELSKSKLNPLNPNDYRQHYIPKQTEMSDENVEIHKLIS